MASFNGELEMAKVLVANGANVNAENANAETPLIIAERYGYVELANFLLVRFSQKVIEIGLIHINLLLNLIFINLVRTIFKKGLFQGSVSKLGQVMSLCLHMFWRPW